MRYSGLQGMVMAITQICKNTGRVAAAIILVICLFSNGAVADTKAAVNREVPGKKNKIDKGVKKRSRGKKPSPGLMGSMDKRKAALKTSFRRAGLDQDAIEGIFSDQRLQLYYNIYTPTELTAEGKKKKKPSYFDEEFGLFKPESIAAGKRIKAENKELFARIETRYGVPADYLVAIVRIETNFKEHLGKYSVFNALYTMSMLDKRVKRVEMAHRELVAWVKMCRRMEMDPFVTKGSWAGAFGIPQFMPSSYALFAVDYDGDGKTDLYDYPDAFASIANYLQRTGWKTGNLKKMRRAVYRYNHEKAYVDAVFAYAGRI